MIKTIIFDLAEVLLTGMKDIERLLEPILNIPAETIEKQLHNSDLKNLFNGKISEDDYWNKMIVGNNWSVDAKLLKETVRTNFQEIDGTRNIVKKLKKSDYNLGLLSVHTREWIDYCEEKFIYHNLFNVVMYSFEVAISKPYIGAYQLLLTKMNASPSETLFIDDSLENVNSAKQLGINSVQFHNAIQLKRELTDLNVL